MTENNQNDDVQENENYPVKTVKVVAEMPDDKEMRDSLQEIKANDGYPDSCGNNSQS